MALQIQINNDTDKKISISRFDETLNFGDESILSNPEIIKYNLDVDVSNTENYETLTNYLSQFGQEQSITSIKLLKNDNVIYNVSRYDKIRGLFLRPNDNEDLIFTVHLEKILEN